MSLLCALSRFSSNEFPVFARTLFTAPRLGVQITPALYAEPLKKKKKLDPAIIKQREERRRKKIEKQIKRLERNARQLKPVEECEAPLELLDEKDIRSRPKIQICPEEMERRALLQKEWARYQAKQRADMLFIIKRTTNSLEKALNELSKESESLYNAAMEIDPQLMPYECKGPVDTPPIENYDSPDGEYIDISRKWT